MNERNPKWAPFIAPQISRQYSSLIYTLDSNADVTVATAAVILCHKSCKLSTLSAYAILFL
jgi:hypothetical protein